MKTIVATAILIFSALAIVAVSVCGTPTQISAEPSRLGVTGRMVFVVTETAAFAESSAIQPGDFLIALSFPEQDKDTEGTSACDLLTNLNRLRSAIANTKPGSGVQVEFLRLSAGGNLEKHSVTLKTLSHPALNSASTLGLVGRIGFMVNDIDPITSQTELGVGDVIVSTAAFGEIADLDKFRESIKKSKIGSSIESEILKLNASRDKYESKSVRLTLYSYPEIRQSKAEAVKKGQKANSFVAASPNTQNCPDNPCRWCCAGCCPFAWSSTCCYFNCETGVFRCQTMETGRCRNISYCL